MIFFLAKFFNDEQHAEQFLRGSLYANRLAYFRNLEGDRNRADAYEGVGLLILQRRFIWEATRARILRLAIDWRESPMKKVL